MRLPRGPNPPPAASDALKRIVTSRLSSRRTPRTRHGVRHARSIVRAERVARARNARSRVTRGGVAIGSAHRARAVRSCAGINADARATSGARCGGRSARGRVVCVVGTFREGVARVDGGGARRRARGRGEFSGVECARWWLTTRAFARRRTVADRCVERATDECMFLCFLV